MLGSEGSHSAPGATTGLVVTLGKSRGASTVAAGIALACSVELEREVLVAELDPAGGELVEKLFFRGQPTTASDPEVPPGARELADRLAGLALDFDPESEENLLGEIDLRSEFTVAIKGLDRLGVILGDSLVGVASHASAVISPRLKRLAGAEGFDTVVVDGGRWGSSEAHRLAGFDVVYAVVEASSTSQLHRCVAEMQALWYELQRLGPQHRMVVVLWGSVWAPGQVVDLFEEPPGAPERDTLPYRVVPLELKSRRERRAAELLQAGRWKLAASRQAGLGPFRGLASVLTAVSRTSAAGEVGHGGEADPGSSIEEFPYLSEGPDVDLGVEADSADGLELGMAAMRSAEAEVGPTASGAGWPFTDFGTVSEETAGAEMDGSLGPDDAGSASVRTRLSVERSGQVHPAPPEPPRGAVPPPEGRHHNGAWSSEPAFDTEQVDPASTEDGEWDPSPAYRAALLAQTWERPPARFRSGGEKA